MICLDGTSNEPESGTTNVARTYAIAAKHAGQLVYYDPGVGTMGARGAVTRIGQTSTRVAGLVVGFGVKDNIQEAYDWLSAHYQRDDRIFVFGFSRGAYTARALTGMLRTVGLLRPGADNLTPYAIKLYTKRGPDDATPEQRTAYFRPRGLFNDRFGNPDFPNPFNPHVHQVKFLGVWDTVKTIGALNLKARFEQAQWPSTRKILNVEVARHAMALDEKRRPYPVYRFDEEAVGGSEGRYVEQWFAGVHSDVGGQYDDHRLSDIAWSVDDRRGGGGGPGDRRQGPQAPRRVPGGRAGARGPRCSATCTPTAARGASSGGWKPRSVRAGDLVHPSVRAKIAATEGTAHPYRPTAHGFS